MFDYFMWTYGGEIIALIVTGIAGCIGIAIKKVWVDKLNDGRKQDIAKAVVLCVEQAWKALHGKEKLAQALITAEEMLRKKGIPFDAEEMTVLIEAAVAEFNEAFKKTTVKGDAE